MLVLIATVRALLVPQLPRRGGWGRLCIRRCAALDPVLGL